MLMNLWNLFMDVSDLVLVICVLVLVPMSIFRRSRKLAALGLYSASYVFGVGAWIYALTVAFNIWGMWAVTIGIALAGIGVVPVAMLAAFFHSEWFAFWSIVVWIGLMIGTRSLSVWIASKTPNELDTA